MSTADWVNVLSVIVAALLAIGGWLFTYFNGLAVDRRSAKLERLNKQLRELYGPLYAQLVANDETWHAFSEKHWPAHGESAYFGDGGDASRLTEQEKMRWVTWMKNVFQPMNKLVADLIVQNIDLVEGEEVPASFLNAVAHVNAYNAILAQWEAGDLSEFVSVNNWPFEALMSDVKPVYKRLRQEQQELLGVSQG